MIPNMPGGVLWAAAVLAQGHQDDNHAEEAQGADKELNGLEY